MIEDMNRYTKGVRERQAELDAKQVAEALKEPTLTCSEVVERLRKEAMVDVGGSRPQLELDPTKAAAILHSWRERRVQELEEALRLINDKTEHTCPTSFRNDSVCCKCVAIGALKSDEWREQIRKGAKHE